MAITVHAAGGVVIRAGDRGAEILVVHRPKYGDWSLPKGKLEPGESFEDAARREVAEETGVVVELGDELASVGYVDRNGRDKLVRYWKMTPAGAVAWEPNDEIGEVRWIAAADAAAVLSYDADRALVAQALEGEGNQ